MLCSSILRDTSLPALALKAAQESNGHGPLCGTDWLPCVQCDAVSRTLAREGERAIRERFSCELVWRNEASDAIAAEQAALYFRVIEPARIDLWRAPVWIADVAEIGDMVRARAEKEIYDAARKGS